MATCELCGQAGGELLWRDASCRIVRIAEPGYPGFCRVIWNAHVKEMTDLPERERAHLMRVVFAVESALREYLGPAKINLASLGNMTPHLHWHVIPRFEDDPHFPLPVWGQQQRERRPDSGDALHSALASALASRLEHPAAASLPQAGM
ncbi:MAG: HIT family protein [Burkholderiales bacterium]|nr:HIT family protein [Burkholderiales bacterium]